jgi:hypothetical protein
MAGFRNTSATVLVALIALASASPALAQTPAREGFVDAGNGVRLSYRVVGNAAEPVVLVNGGPGFTSDYLADDLTTMARNHALFIYDQRGIGRSTLVSDSASLAAQRYVDDLEAIRTHLGREQLTAGTSHDSRRHRSARAERIGSRLPGNGRRPGQRDASPHGRTHATPSGQPR